VILIEKVGFNTNPKYFETSFDETSFDENFKVKTKKNAKQVESAFLSFR